jgi:hypothetical protein
MVGVFFEQPEAEDVLLETRHGGHDIGGDGAMPDTVKFFRHVHCTPLIRTRRELGTRLRTGVAYAKVKYFSYAPVTSFRCLQYCHMPPL